MSEFSVNVIIQVLVILRLNINYEPTETVIKSDKYNKEKKETQSHHMERNHQTVIPQ